jgi:hypothetical protein
MAAALEDGALTSGAALASTIDEDQACPVCGRSSWIDGWVPASPRPALDPWWPWLFVVVGLYLVSAFSLRAWQASELMPSVAMQTSCLLALEAGHGNLAACALAQHAADSFARSVAVVAVAGFMLLIGAVRLTRQTRRDRINLATGHRLVVERPSAPIRAISRIEPILTFGETLLVPCFQMLIAITTGYLIAALVRGGSSPGDVVNAALDHTINLAAFGWSLLEP